MDYQTGKMLEEIILRLANIEMKIDEITRLAKDEPEKKRK